jgi:hypothetical protein
MLLLIAVTDMNGHNLNKEIVRALVKKFYQTLMVMNWLLVFVAFVNIDQKLEYLWDWKRLLKAEKIPGNMDSLVCE